MLCGGTVKAMTTEMPTETREVTSPGPIEPITLDEVRRLRAENERLREALEGVLTILGNPDGYCLDDRTEVAHARAEAERGLERRR
jgi:hypothetical protein